MSLLSDFVLLKVKLPRKKNEIRKILDIKMTWYQHVGHISGNKCPRGSIEVLIDRVHPGALPV